MNINFNRQALLDCLSLLTSVVPSRTPKPILKCVLISAKDKHIRLSATDLEVGISYVLSEAEVVEPGEFVVPADRLAAIVRESTDEVLRFTASEDACQIRGCDSQFTIYGHKAEQFPPVSVGDKKGDVEVGLEELQASVQQCLFATAKESSRYALNGVLWEIKGKKLFLVATDGRRLARSRAGLASAPSERMAKEKIIVPAKAMALIEKLHAGDKDRVSVALLNNQVQISCGHVEIVSNLVEGNFPKYEDIIPSDYDKKLVLSTEAALSAVRRCALLTTDESRGIKLSLDKGTIVFSCRAPEAGDARIELAVDYKGAAVEIGFNPHFLIDALRVIPAAEFEFELGQADRPGLIKSGADFLYVLMPLNLG